MLNYFLHYFKYKSFSYWKEKLFKLNWLLTLNPMVIQLVNLSLCFLQEKIKWFVRSERFRPVSTLWRLVSELKNHVKGFLDLHFFVRQHHLQIKLSTEITVQDFFINKNFLITNESVNKHNKTSFTGDRGDRGLTGMKGERVSIRAL